MSLIVNEGVWSEVWGVCIVEILGRFTVLFKTKP